MNIFALFVSFLLIYLGVLECFVINRTVLPSNQFLLFSLSEKKKKNVTQQVSQGKDNKLKGKKKKKKKKCIALEKLLREHVEKVNKREFSDSENLDVDKEILEGKRIPRLRIKSTQNHIYATVVDDYRRHILCFSGSRDPKLSGVLGTYRKKSTNRVVNNGRTIKSGWEIGKDIARKALNKGIFRVRFDRGKFKYAGKVEALAEGARAVGLLL
ncbi:50S ribosomal protein L18 [Plasmodium gonderi]|uniref:50S ribosomal protein L18 n=1 Tax=Plasmodium gonderi TaxID=77519 RepID=A0A1Y1JH78_PLAGO|nr:50S ribosomal protein L18 [Plasmodium gonderi]GAW81889.1 50S ribosomal protein L18 [Plasmodium gonderi]